MDIAYILGSTTCQIAGRVFRELQELGVNVIREWLEANGV